MKKHVSITAMLVVALLTSLTPVCAAHAAPMSQMRLPGNLSPRLTRVPGTVLNTQTRLGNLGGNLLSSPAIGSLDVVQTTRRPVVDRITRIVPPLVTVDSTRYLRSVDGLARRPSTVASMTSLYEAAFLGTPDLSVSNNKGNGADNAGGGSGGDGNDGGGDDENGGGKKGGGKGSSGAGGNGSGPGYSPPEPPDLDYFYYVDDDDDDERKRIVSIIQMYKSQFGMYKSQFGGIRRIMGLGGTGFSAP